MAAGSASIGRTLPGRDVKATDVGLRGEQWAIMVPTGIAMRSVGVSTGYVATVAIIIIIIILTHFLLGSFHI